MLCNMWVGGTAARGLRKGGGGGGGLRPWNVTMMKGNIRLGTYIMLCDVM